MAENHLLKTKLGRDGRVVIPAKLRRQLGLKPNALLTARVASGQLILEDPRLAWRALQEYLRPFRQKSGKRPISEELIEERREEAKKEDR